MVAVNEADNQKELDDRLQAELFHVHKSWDEFGRNALMIKQWAFTISAAGIAAIAAKAPAFLIAGAAYITICSLWMLESLWKHWQHAHGPRLDALSDHFLGVTRLTEPLQFHRKQMSKQSERQLCRILHEFGTWGVVIPYLPLAISFATIALLSTPSQ